MLGIDFDPWNTDEWAQVTSALFTALAALAASATVLRIGRDRRRSTWPELHVELIGDKPGNQVRLTIVNHGGPAREVAAWGVVGEFGFGGYTEPSTYWQPGERRTFLVHMPPGRRGRGPHPRRGPGHAEALHLRHHVRRRDLSVALAVPEDLDREDLGAPVTGDHSSDRGQVRADPCRSDRARGRRTTLDARRLR